MLSSPSLTYLLMANDGIIFVLLRGSGSARMAADRSNACLVLQSPLIGMGCGRIYGRSGISSYPASPALSGGLGAFLPTAGLCALEGTCPVSLARKRPTTAA